MEYDFKRIEKEWQDYWREHKTYQTRNNSSSPKYYVLDMFPYPSGAGLHVGHPLGYIASDIYARYKRLKGFNVLHPMGYDAFGLPAEQYAIQTGQHPAVTTEKNISRYREQLDKIGFSFDWDREVKTCDPLYYKWTQWIFLKLFNSWYNRASDKAEPVVTLQKIFESEGNKNVSAVNDEVKIFTAAEWKSFSEKEQQQLMMNYRLAYLSETFVNWCPALGTVLANEEVKDGVSERGGYPVERKRMPQWSLRITAYAQRLLDGLNTIDWSESLKEAQRNWIGRSEGCSITFGVRSQSASQRDDFAPAGRFAIEVFTTRPDTIFGVTFMVLAPEHELVPLITTPDRKKAVEDYVAYAKGRSERDRMADVKKITGEFTGAYMEHPFTGKPVPVWIGDYVLAGYGTGAVMAVPGHDSRDHAFAKHFGLDILPVVEMPAGWNIQKESYDAKEGKAINSDFLNGLDVKDSIRRAIEEVEKRGLGKRQINFRLRDAIFGRQRYWGEPIPVYYKDGIPYPMDESDLPLKLPEVDKFLPTETGEPPLARASADWKYKGRYEYEKTTMPGWAGSSWYYLRYMDPENKKAFASREAVDYWREVDLYIGGSEHATGHLMYVRFWTKFLHDLGYIPIDEPAKKLINQGMIQGVSSKEFWISDSAKAKIFLKGYISKIIGEVVHQSNSFMSDYFQLHFGEQVKTFLISADFLNEYNSDPENYYSVLERNLPISYVEHNVLDVKRFIDSEEGKQYRDAIFICRDGYWKDGTFIPYQGINNPKSKNFLVKSEVEKMSKSKLNVVNPDDMIELYGADTLRMYEMFLGPLEMSKPWNTNGITGVHNFLKKLWRLFQAGISEETASKAELKVLHKTIKKVGDDIERFSFNTSVSTFMICVNELTDLKCSKRQILEPLVVLLSPFAPHIAEELWQKRLGKTESVTGTVFPSCKEEYLADDSFEYPVSINGKTRFKLHIALNLSKEEIEKEVLSAEEMKKFLESGSPKKIIVVPGRIVNVVI